MNLTPRVDVSVDADRCKNQQMNIPMDRKVAPISHHAESNMIKRGYLSQRQAAKLLGSLYSLIKAFTHCKHNVWELGEVSDKKHTACIKRSASQRLPKFGLPKMDAWKSWSQILHTTHCS